MTPEERDRILGMTAMSEAEIEQRIFEDGLRMRGITPASDWARMRNSLIESHDRFKRANTPPPKLSFWDKLRQFVSRSPQNREQMGK